MSLFTRARRHVDMNRVKKLREEKIKEETIAEVQRQQENILAELKKIEIKESPKYSNWRRELNEAVTMSTAEMGMINLPPNEFDVGAEANKNASTHPTFGADGTLDPSNDYWMMNNAPEEGSAAITISLEIDLSLVDSIDAQIYFTNATIDPAYGMDIIIEGPIGSGISPQIVPVSVPGSGSGSAAPRIVINKDLRIKNAIVSYSVIGNGGEEDAREIGTDAIQITSTVIYRRAPVNVLVSLDDPDANSFIRDGQTDKLSPAEKKKKLEDQLKAGSDYLDKMFGKDVMPKGATKIADYEPQQSFMDIQVGDQRITKVNNKTVTDTTKKIKDGKMDGKPIYYDNQGNMRVSEPKPQPKPKSQPKSTTTTTSNTDKTPSWSITDAPKTTTFTSTTDTPPQQKEIQNTVKNDPKVSNAVEKLGTAGKTYLDYLTNNLPDVIDNNYLGREYVNSIFKDAKINQLGTVSVGDNIVGTGGKPTYDPKTKTVSIPFNYDFKTNDQEFSDPSKAGRVNDFQKAVLNAVGPYSADAQLNTPILPLNSLAGIVLGGAIGVSKALGGGQAKKGNVTMNADKLKKINPTLHKQLVKEEVLTEKKKLKSVKDITSKIPGYYDGKPSPLGFPLEEPPKTVNGYHPDLVDGKKVAQRFNRLDPISARSMPPTGNPHIDKKVRAAAKKPK